MNARAPLLCTVLAAAVLPCLGRAGLAATPVATPAAVLVDNSSFDARLVAVAPNWQLTFELAGGVRKQLAAADLCWWGRWFEPTQDAQTLLVDGSLLIGDVTSLTKERAMLDGSVVGTVKLPLEAVAGIVVRSPGDPQHADLPRDALSEPAKTDRVLLANGDQLPGEIQSLDDDLLKVATAAGVVNVKYDKIAAIAFNPALAAKPRMSDARAWLGLRDGSRLLVAGLQSDGGKLQATLAAGPKLSLAMSDVTALQPLGGRTVYLSDLKPAGYQHIPWLTLAWPWHADRNVQGTQLRADGQLYLKGIGMHSAARLTYDLAGPYRTFAAAGAIDDQTAGQGSAVLKVYTDDGSGHWTLKFDSPIIRGGAVPLPIAVDLTGAKRISLLVDFADQGDVQAHADWLNARLLK